MNAITAILEDQYLEEHPLAAGMVEPHVRANGGEVWLPDIPLITEKLLSDKWEKTEGEWFVDSSGFGHEDEPALTTDQFLCELREYVCENPDHGFGLTDVGQFQVYVSAYRRKT